MISDTSALSDTPIKNHEHEASVSCDEPVQVLALASTKYKEVSVWRSGNALDSINVVTLRWARLVPGRVTVIGRVNHLGTEPGTQVDSA